MRVILVIGLALGLTVACQPEEPFADIVRIDCTQFGWFSVQSSSTEGTLELQTGTGDIVWSGPGESLQRTAVRDWHPTRGGHIKVLRAVVDARYASPKSSTPLCGVVLEPEGSDV